ncbi:hypothetical protein pipiens_003456 [Culex pipiens pipiens]|uniref:Uncharacterized protein n=1 Tax=Culex pipiens pipiens TaxID=38569 RepID=A0ABD1CXK9_CULPP
MSSFVQLFLGLDIRPVASKEEEEKTVPVVVADLNCTVPSGMDLNGEAIDSSLCGILGTPLWFQSGREKTWEKVGVEDRWCLQLAKTDLSFLFFTVDPES